MDEVTSLAQIFSSGCGSGSDQLGHSDTVPGMFGRFSDTAASSSVAATMADGARARTT